MVNGLRGNHAHLPRGFTLVELMITVAVLGVLLVLAFPSFTQLIQTQRVRTLAIDLHKDLVFARSEAIKRNANVTVTPKDAGAPPNWGRGWQVRDVGGVVLKDMDPQEGEVSASGGGQIVFGAAGRPTGGAFAVTVSHAGLAAANWRCVAVNVGGRASIASGGC